MRAKKLVSLLESAKRVKQNRFREHYYLRPGASIVCESKDHYEWWESFDKALKEGHIKPTDFSFREIFEAAVPDGREMVESWNPGRGPGGGVLLEAGGAVTTSDFSNITGQIVYNATIEDLTPETYPFQDIIPTQSTQFDGEKIAGIAGLGDQAEIVPENDEYPLIGTSEDWIDTPQTTKRGFIVPISKEALFFDRTGDIIRKAGAVGESLRLNKEKRAIDCVIDENTTAHRFKWRNTSYATYQTTTPWDNTTASNALVDWTDIDNANQTLNVITDPNTGEPVVIEADTLIVTKELEQVANRIRSATDIIVHVGGYATSGDLSDTKWPNPFKGAFEILTSRLLKTRLGTDTSWFYGNPRAAFRYMENWPITVTQAPAGSQEEFHRDIVTQFKCSERGQYATIQPRVMQTSLA